MQDNAENGSNSTQVLIFLLDIFVRNIAVH